MADRFLNDIVSLASNAVDSFVGVDKSLSKLVINKLVETTRDRPHPWSTASDYTSWKSLTDKSYQARQLPVAAAKPQPPSKDVTRLFARSTGEQALSAKSTCLFPAFAQYLTDGFLRTDPRARNRTTSNHDIDLCPLYGRTEAQTNVLRANDNTVGHRGRLKSQTINGEEYPLYLYTHDGSLTDPLFATLDPPLLGPPGAPDPAPEQKASLFAIGGDRANATPYVAMMNTLFLREHNRVAWELEQRNPSWDDERVFQTARNILIPMFIKIVVEQYINHISPVPFNLVADPSVAWTANWNRPNWMTAEFSLLYRWHSLMPDAIAWPGRAPIPLGSFGLDNRPLTEVGLARAFAAAAQQPAAELGARNTAEAILPIEWLAVEQARFNHIDTYNAYRQAYGMAPAQSFSDITSDRSIAVILEELYTVPENIELYPGLFAEDRVDNSPLPGLLLRMVGVDAFSQALTNPLLSEHVWNETTFTAWGFQLIKDTRTLGDILARQGAAINPAEITMTQPDWRYGVAVA